MSIAKEDLHTARRLAILHTAFIGDVALAAVLAQKIKDLAPQAELHFITTPQAAPLAECFAAVDQVHVFDKRGSARGIAGMRKFAAQLAELSFDGMIVPHRSLRSTLLARWCRPGWSLGFNSAGLAKLHTFTEHYQQHLHEVDRNLALLRRFLPGGTSDYADLRPRSVAVDLAPDVSGAVDQLLQDCGLDYGKGGSTEILAIAPGSVWPTKRWPTSKFRELITMLKSQPGSTALTPLLVGGPADREICDSLAQDLNIANLAGRTSLPELLEILRRSALLLSNDSAPTHLANLINCPVAVLFGPTIPEFGFAPRKAHDRVIQMQNMPCRPCSIHGPRRCPLGTHACMHEIPVESVLDTLKDMHAIASKNS